MKKLIDLKTCSCKAIHAFIPSSAKYSTDSLFGGAYWNCPCGSTLYAPYQNIDEETCDCDACQTHPEGACSGDCESGDLCPGCRERELEAIENRYEIACLRGEE